MSSVKNPNIDIPTALPVNRALRRRQLLAVQRGAALRPQAVTSAKSTRVGDVLATPRLLPSLSFAPSIRPSAIGPGVSLREVAQGTTPAIARRAADLWQATPSDHRNAHPIQLVVAHALMAAPGQHEQMLDELVTSQVLSGAARQQLGAALTRLAGYPQSPVSAFAAPDAFGQLLAALPFPVAEALVQARGKAIQEQLTSWSEDLREQAKLDAEVQKRAHEAATRRQQQTLSHRLAQYQSTQVQQRRTLAQAAVERALVRLAEVSPQPEVFGSTRATSAVPYASRALRGPGVARRAAVEIDEVSLTSAAASLRALSPTTLKAAFALAQGSDVAARPYTPNYQAAFAAPSHLAMGPSLRQPSHALEAVDLPGRALV